MTQDEAILVGAFGQLKALLGSRTLGWYLGIWFGHGIGC